jgi:hypothetical protein
VRTKKEEGGLEEGGRAGGTDGAAAVAEADAEGREEDGAQELQPSAVLVDSAKKITETNKKNQ